MNPTNGLNGQNRRITIKGNSIVHSIEGFNFQTFIRIFLWFSVEKEVYYPTDECLLGLSTSNSQYHNNLNNSIPNPQSIITNHQPYLNTDYLDQYPNPNTYTSVPMNASASAFTTTNISNFPHLNENQSDQVWMHSLGAVDSKDLINLDGQDIDVMSILDNLSTSLEKIQIHFV